jgi:hypothetical protein
MWKLGIQVVVVPSVMILLPLLRFKMLSIESVVCHKTYSLNLFPLLYPYIYYLVF